MPFRLMLSAAVVAMAASSADARGSRFIILNATIAERVVTQSKFNIAGPNSVDESLFKVGDKFQFKARVIDESDWNWNWPPREPTFSVSAPGITGAGTVPHHECATYIACNRFIISKTAAGDRLDYRFNAFEGYLDCGTPASGYGCDKIDVRDFEFSFMFLDLKGFDPEGKTLKSNSFADLKDKLKFPEMSATFGIYGYNTHAGLELTLGDLRLATVPEPASWAMMIGGFGMLGAAARRRDRTAVTYA